jgi:hypothetical protein
MSLPSWLRWRTGDLPRARNSRPRAAGHCRSRLALEQLEDRTVPSSFTVGSLSDLIADINAANAAGGSNTITLVAGTTFTLSAVNNTTDGATGLPVVAANDNLTIVGNGDVIQRSTASGVPAFRLVDVANGASLTLENLTLQGGLALGPSLGVAQGGAILNQGALTLNAVTVQANIARGSDGSTLGENGGPAAGGGIYSSGSLTLANCTFQNNKAIGGQGQLGIYGGFGGGAYGGGLCVVSGTATLTGMIISSNSAQGGTGGATQKKNPDAGAGSGGDAQGGGLDVASGTVTLTGVTVVQNTAQGGSGGKAGGNSGSPGLGQGGGIYIDPAASVFLDAFTLANVKSNHASTSGPNIYGSYTVE